MNRLLIYKLIPALLLLLATFLLLDGLLASRQVPDVVEAKYIVSQRYMRLDYRVITSHFKMHLAGRAALDNITVGTHVQVVTSHFLRRTLQLRVPDDLHNGNSITYDVNNFDYASLNMLPVYAIIVMCILVLLRPEQKWADAFVYLAFLMTLVSAFAIIWI